MLYLLVLEQPTLTKFSHLQDQTNNKEARQLTVMIHSWVSFHSVAKDFSTF